MKSWLGLVGPAHLPSEVVDRISQALRTALGISEVRDSLAKLAVQVDYANSAEFALIVKAQMIAWADAARLAGLKQE
jgi:tripartite-type tricarboxylate transporter receptor subunit TctC